MSQITEDKAKEFMQLYLQNQRRIYGFISAVIPNKSDAEDLAQEVFSIIWAKFETFESGTNFSAWALAIARFRVLAFQQKNAKEQKMFSDQAIKSIHNVFLSNEQEDRDRHEALHACLAKLTAADREILKMRYNFSGTIRDMADYSKRSVHTLYKTLSRIHRLLHQCITKSLAGDKMG